MKRNELAGQRFNRLVVVADAGVNRRQNVLWKCQCDCGGTAIAPAYELRAGKVKSCGCLVREGANVTHGLARGGAKRSRVYSIWASMVQRCTNPNDRNYHHYGGRGITVCQRWRTFENFYKDMGDRPAGMSLERVNNARGYSPANCVWATTPEQNRNRRNNVWVAAGGTQMLLSDALRAFGKTIGSIHYWMRKLNTDHQGVIDLWQAQKKRL